MSNIQKVLDSFIGQFDNLDASKRLLVTTAAIGLMAGYGCELPSSPVNDRFSYRMNVVDGQLEQQMSDIVESCVFNWDMAKEIARRVWETRYNMLHGPSPLDACLIFSSLCKQSGSTISPEIACLLKQLEDRPLAITTLLNRL